MDKVRIGIIGLGGMGSNHATYLSQGQIAGAELAAVADVDPARLATCKPNTALMCKRSLEPTPCLRPNAWTL